MVTNWTNEKPQTERAMMLQRLRLRPTSRSSRNADVEEASEVTNDSTLTLVNPSASASSPICSPRCPTPDALTKLV